MTTTLRASKLNELVEHHDFGGLVGPSVVVRGRGQFSDREWLRIELAHPTGAVSHVHITPWRLDLDAASGNEHEHREQVQLVACQKLNGRYGPGVVIHGDLVTRDSSRFSPSLLMGKVREPALRWDDCVDGDRLSPRFASMLQEFVGRYSVPAGSGGRDGEDRVGGREPCG